MKTGDLLNPSIDKMVFDDIIYSVNGEEKTLKIHRNESEKESIIIPFSIIKEKEEYIVTILSGGSFKYSKKLKNISFAPDSKLHTIGKYAFFNSSIECITIPPHQN